MACAGGYPPGTADIRPYNGTERTDGSYAQTRNVRPYVRPSNAPHLYTLPRLCYTISPRAVSSGAERYLDTVEVGGSSPPPPTRLFYLAAAGFTGAAFAYVSVGAQFIVPERA